MAAPSTQSGVQPPPPTDVDRGSAESSVNAVAVKQGVPTNLEAETFVLGSVLLDDRKFPQVAGAVEEDDFAFEKHRRIFRCMRELSDRGEQIDYITLSNELVKSDHLDKVGGGEYLVSLTEGMPRLENLDAYTKIVKDKSTLRKLIFTAQDIVANCMKADKEVAEVLAAAETSVMNVGTGLLSTGLESPRTTLDGFEGGSGAFLDPSKRTKGLPSPFHRFDELTNGMRPGQLIIIAARPAMGKTALALNMASYLASPQRDQPAKTVAVFSLEMSREALLTRIVCAEARVDQRRFRGGFLQKAEKKRLADALNQLVESRLFIDDTANIGIFEIAAKCRRLQAEHGLDLVIIDYLQLLGSAGRVESRVQEISSFSRGLKLLAKDLAIPVVALSQLSRAPEDPRRGDHRPRLSDLRDSGSIEQDADLVGFIFRGEVYKPDDASLSGLAELIIGKQRNGPTGSIKLAFLKQFAKFDNIAEEMEGAPEPPPPPSELGDDEAPF